MPREIGQAEAAGTNGGYGEDVKDMQMIQRSESHRNRPPLPVTAALFHHLEAANAAHDAAHDGGNEDRAAGLLAYRNAVLAQLTAPQNGGAT